MPFNLVFVPLFILASQIPSDPLHAPPDPIFPLPLYKEMPPTGSLISNLSHSYLSFGWQFSDGSQFRGGKYCRPVSQSDYVNHVAFLGPSSGIISEWYLGHGLSSSLTLGFPDLESAIGIEWYPIEGFTVSLSLDLLRREVRFGWELANPEDCLDLFDPLFAAYALYSWIESAKSD